MSGGGPFGLKSGVSSTFCLKKWRILHLLSQKVAYPSPLVLTRRRAERGGGGARAGRPHLGRNPRWNLNLWWNSTRRIGCVTMYGSTTHAMGRVATECIRQCADLEAREKRRLYTLNTDRSSVLL